MTKKVVVTNLGRLYEKYGTDGVSRIEKAVNELIAADDRRGIQTQVLALDSVPDMEKVNAPPVVQASDPCQNKNAIDAVYRTLVPEYIVLLGATDVIPHQDLKNPVTTDKVDIDKIAWGDIPYACEAPYSQDPGDFIGPTRVMGRIPDLTNATDPSYLVTLLKTASNWRARDPEDYGDYLGISAWIWRKSTERSLRHVFGGADALQVSPTKGPRWRRSLISRRLHFVNCHGSQSKPDFYGQRGKHNFPISHSAAWISTRLAEGTIAAAECCYGAELYDPVTAPQQRMGICNTYLANGAYGFFGSTTIAYGGYVVNEWADLICQFFLKKVLSGTSLGRAVLEARQQYAQSKEHLGPIDLKTLAQFNLLGDPSIHPVRSPAPDADVKLVSGTHNERIRMDFAAYERSSRRRRLFDIGTYIAKTWAVATDPRPLEPGSHIAIKMRELVRANGLHDPAFLSFSIKRPTTGELVDDVGGRLPQPTGFKVAIGKTGPIVQGVAPAAFLLVEDLNDEIVSVKRGVSR